MKFLIEEHGDINNQYIGIVGTELQVLNKWLDEHGFEIELIDNYNFGNSKAVGMFLRTEQDDASVFPVALNKDALINGSNELSYDDYSLKNELTYAIRGTLWHEAGHGIFDFLSDIYYLDDLDEEDIVEEFAEYGEDSELFNILVQYEKDSLNEHLLIEMPEKVDKMKLSQEQDRRRKLTDEQKEEIRKLYSTGMHSLNSLAREYGVSKKTILLIVNPDSKAKSDARIKAHWQDYYDREEHNKAIKNLRNYKKDLLKKGELKENKSNFDIKSIIDAINKYSKVKIVRDYIDKINFTNTKILIDFKSDLDKQPIIPIDDYSKLLSDIAKLGYKKPIKTNWRRVVNRFGLNKQVLGIDLIPTNSDNINEKLEPLDPEVEDIVDSDALVSSDPYEIRNFLVGNKAFKLSYFPKENFYVVIDPYELTHWDILPDLYEYGFRDVQDTNFTRWYFVPTEELDELESGYLGEYTEKDFRHFKTYVYRTGYMICLDKDNFKGTSLYDAFGKPLEIGILYDLLKSKEK